MSYVTDFVARRLALIEELGTTFFEATTAMAFQYFVDSAVDVAVIETGLGGRLDSTNVVRPLVAGVSSIGIDHVEYLGETLEEIAFEKAGIYKDGVPAASGEPDPRIDALLAGHAAQHHSAGMVSVWRDAPPQSIEVGAHGTRFVLALDGAAHALSTPLAGAHQASNATLALLMLRAAGAPYWNGWDGIAEGLQRVRLPGRFHVAPPYIFDVAHNPRRRRDARPHAHARAPAAAGGGGALHPRRQGLAGDVARAGAGRVALRPHRCPDRARGARVGSGRGDASTLRRAGGRRMPSPISTPRCNRRASRGATVLVAGSFHTVGDAMARLQVDPLAG